MFSVSFVVGDGEEDVGHSLKQSDNIRISGLAYDVVERQGRLSELGDDFIRLHDGPDYRCNVQGRKWVLSKLC